ncbi:MAG: RNA polymerase sigma factor [Bacteroidales bacterium]|jgi:RNA polymerase sigma factor (sigma-70 family)
MMTKEESFEFIINNYKSMILNVCRIYSNGEREEMRDLFQEVLLNIWKGLSTFEGKSSVKTWIYRVALNTAISHLRKKKKQIPIVEIKEGFDQLIDKNKPDEQLEILYKAIEKLNEVDKSLIFLYLENKSHKEIAEILGISISNVGTRIQRVKIKLEHIIKNNNYDKK